MSLAVYNGICVPGRKNNQQGGIPDYAFSAARNADGAAVVDSSGSKNRAEQPGKCLETNGTNQHGLIGQIDLNATDLTILIWFKRTTANTQALFRNRDNAPIGTGVPGVFFGTSGSDGWGNSGFEDSAGNNVSHSSYDNDFLDSVWHCALLDFDTSTGTTRLIFDNVVVSTQTNAALIGADFTRPNFYIGNSPDLAQGWNGQLFNPQVFKRLLTLEEIDAIWQQGQNPQKPLTLPVPAHAWRLDQRSRMQCDAQGQVHCELLNYVTSMHYEGKDVPYSTQNLVGFDQGFTGSGTATGGLVDQVDVGNALDNGTGPLSYSFSIIPAASDLTDFRMVVCKVEDTASSRPGWQTYFRNTGELRTNLGEDISSAGERTFRDCSEVFEAGKKYDVTVNWDGTDITYLVNGQVRNGAYGEQNATGHDLTSNGKLLIGGWLDSNNDRWYFAGLIANVVAQSQEYGTPNVNVPLNVFDEFDTEATYLPNAKTGRVARNGTLKNSPCLTLNGTNQDVGLTSEIVLSTVDAWKIRGRVIKGDTSNGMLIGKTATNFHRIYWFSNSVCIHFGNGESLTIDYTYNDDVGVAVEFEFTCNNGVFAFYIDGVEQNISANTYTTVTDFRIDNIGFPYTSGALYWDGQLFDISIEQAGVVTNHWPMSEGAGNKVYDRVGSSHGIVNNYASSVWNDVQDVYHSSVQNGFDAVPYFNGTDSIVLIEDANEYSFGDSVNDTPFSLSLICRIDTFGDGLGGLLAKADNTLTNTNEWILTANSTGNLVFSCYDDVTANSIRAISDMALQEGELYRVDCTYDGSGTELGINLYVNGTLISSTKSENGTYTAMHNTPSKLAVGNMFRLNSSPQRILNGIVADVSIWSVELTPDNITYLYNNNVGIPPNESDRVQQWLLNEGFDEISNTESVSNLSWIESPISVRSVLSNEPGVLNSRKTEVDFRPVETSPDLRNFLIPGDGTLPEYAFAGNHGAIEVALDTFNLKSGFSLDNNFNPFHLGYVVGWYDDDKTVDRWGDKSWLKNHAIQTAAGNQPTLDGLALSFDGVDDFMRTLASVDFGNDTTIIAVMDPPLPVGQEGFVSIAAGQNDVCLGSWDSGSRLVVYDGNGTGLTLQNIAGGSSVYLNGGIFVYMATLESQACLTYANNNLLLSDTLNSSARNGPIVFGALDSGDRPGLGKLFEVCVVNKKVTDAERTKIQDYYVDKYSIT